MTRLNLPLFVALAASILSAVPVDGRDALPHQRMIRKRGPAGFDGPGPIGAAAVVGLRVRQATDEPTGSASQSVSAAPTSTSAAASTTRVATTSSAAAPTTTAAATSSTAAPATTSTSSPVSTAQATTSSGGLLDSLTAVLGGSTSSTLSSSSSTPVSSSTPAAASSTQAAAPTTTQQQQQQPATQTTPTLNIATPSPSATARNPSVSVSVVTSTQQPEAAASASASAEAAKAKTAKITRNTIVSLVVVASCIGGAIAIWTVIRKWKLSPSEKFDDRMQPIDWAPPPANGATEEAIEEKSKHRRVGSGASHGSFTSGGVGQSEQGHGAKYADSQHGYPPQDFPPPHDFTAGTTQPGGYGQYYGGQQYATGPGYADLQRGPSLSESNYSHGANVSRGLSYSRGHGAYDSQSSAPPMPNPYGGEYGYEDYNHPPAGQQPQAQGQGQVPYRAF